jgi:uncharacterized protein (TIGR02246 family)
MTTETSAASTPKIPDALMAEIVAVPGRLVSAWAAHDAEAFSQLFTQDGALIMPGIYKKGRDEIRQFMEAGYAGPYKGTSVTGTPLDIKPIGAGAVALLTVGGVLAPGEKEVSTKQAIRASWILVKDDGTWRLAVYQNSPRDPAS